MTEKEFDWMIAVNLRHVYFASQAIVPQMRNRGIGTDFLEWMKGRADRKRKDLTVELMAASRARALLERMGFKPVPGTGRMVTMRY